jgi:2-dehydro-3-deoxygalactonokinase
MINPSSSLHPTYALADWGTTHLRVWLTDPAGTLFGERMSNEGMGGLKPDQFQNVLEAQLTAMNAPRGLPVMICGMAGSRQGWREAAYVEAPAHFSSLSAQATSFQAAGRSIHIMPGVARLDAKRPDVMRGEETQLLGLGIDEGVACLPGTHSKWVRIKEGCIEDFATVMTGEMFALLTQHSILRHATNNHDGSQSKVLPDDPYFAEGVTTGLTGEGALSRLFSVRAGSLLNGRTPQQSIAHLSGLLIGTEIMESARLMGVLSDDVHVIGTGALARLYRAALQQANRICHVHDGGALVRAGLLAAANRIYTAEPRAAE